MSVDYSAYAVIGMRLDPEKLYGPPKKVKAFKHDHPESMKFDPQTGKELWEDEKVPVKEYDPDKETLGGYKLVFGTDNEECFVSVVHVETDYGESSDVTKLPNGHDLNILRNGMEEKLRPLGLWDEKEFGLWAVLYCSY